MVSGKGQAATAVWILWTRAPEPSKVFEPKLILPTLGPWNDLVLMVMGAKPKVKVVERFPAGAYWATVRRRRPPTLLSRLQC